MHFKNKQQQQRYQGFLQTPNLWEENAIYDLNQYELSSEIDAISIVVDDKQRLGKYIEQFVLFNLKQQSQVNLVAENLQILEDKRTIGELDCIFKQNETIIHLEIVYKFYLYVLDESKEELHGFVGPNRKDSLMEKLEKLKNKQLPLLYHNATKPYLDDLEIESNAIQQKVCFKAQLFIPYKKKDAQFNTINNDCVEGFYINKKGLEDFKNCKFYIPIKKDWLLIPHQHVNWLPFSEFKSTVQQLLSDQFSPLCWVKKENGEIEKFFLVWWD